VCIAYNVLSNPILRARYDSGRILNAEELIKLASDAALSQNEVTEDEDTEDEATEMAPELLEMERQKATSKMKDKMYSPVLLNNDINVAVSYQPKRTHDKMDLVNDTALPQNNKPAIASFKNDDQSLHLPIHSMLTKDTPDEQASSSTLLETTSPHKRLKLSDSQYTEPTTPRNGSALPPKELTGEEIVMRNIADLKTRMDQETERAGNVDLQIARSEGEKKYIYVKDMSANRYVKILRKS
jgi:hypothetical protein